MSASVLFCVCKVLVEKAWINQWICCWSSYSCSHTDDKLRSHQRERADPVPSAVRVKRCDSGFSESLSWTILRPTAPFWDRRVLVPRLWIIEPMRPLRNGSGRSLILKAAEWFVALCCWRSLTAGASATRDESQRFRFLS